MIKKIIYSILILGAVGAGIGYYMFTKPLDSIESLKTHYTLSPDELLTSFENDEGEANITYLDKVIEVTGIVSKTEKNNGISSVYIATSNELSSVIFQLEKEDSNIEKGNEITIKGICTGYLMDVVLVRSKRI